MTAIYIPFPKELYDDLIIMTKRQLDPTMLSQELILDLVERNLDSLAFEWFGDNLEKFVAKHLPASASRVTGKASSHVAKDGSLIWKSLVLPPMTQLRMNYGGRDHFAKVKNGKVFDGEEYYSPSRWACKVADNTSRNAWRDIYFKRPAEDSWILADTARQQYQA